MKERCSYCLTIRERSRLFENEPGVWYCRVWAECRAFYAMLPDFLRRVAA